MPDPVFISGSLGTITLGGDPLVNGFVVGLNLTRNIMNKAVIGQPYAYALSGQRSGTFSANGGISAAEQADLHALFESDTPIAFSMVIGASAGANAAGEYEGNFVVNSFDISVDGSGEWDWSLNAQTTGAVSYTPPA